MQQLRTNAQVTGSPWGAWATKISLVSSTAAAHDGQVVRIRDPEIDLRGRGLKTIASEVPAASITARMSRSSG